VAPSPTPRPYDGFAHETPMSVMPAGQTGEQMLLPNSLKPALHTG
jgi:hypothetical protein